MSTAQILFEQYKVLPRKVKKELKSLIDEEENEKVEVSVKHLREGLKELKLVLSGQAQATPIEELLKELENES